MNQIKKITQSPLFRVSSFNSVSLLVRIFTGLVSSKAIAYFIGPSGMALMGNFRNFTSTLDAVGILGIQNGVVKTIAETYKNKTKLFPLLTTLFYILILFSVLIGAIVILFSNYITKSLFNGIPEYQYAIILSGFLLPFSILHLFFIAVINGFSWYKKVIKITIFSYVFGLIVSIFLMWQWSVLGAMVAVSIMSLFLFLFSGYYFSKLISLKELLKFSYFDFSQIKIVLVFASMTLFSAILTPIVYIFIRKLIISFQSIEAAGFYEAMNRVSGFYMMFVTTLVSLYFLPELSKTNEIQENKPIIRQFYKTVLPVFFIGIVVLFFLKTYIVQVLFNKDFKPVTNLFFWQLTGDFFRASALILAIQFYAKKLIKPYFITEIISFVILITSSYFAIEYWGVEGAVIAYAFTYFMYFVVVVIYFRKIVF